MQNFDLIVMITGIVLITAGVLLFLTGKVVSQNNQIEAFGVKINFNNPSFLLVAAGIGLLLVPRLLPAPQELNQLPPTSAGAPTPATGPASMTATPARPIDPPAASLDGGARPEQPVAVSRPASPPPMEATIPEPTVAMANPTLTGEFDLLSYQMNGMPQEVDGMLAMYPMGPDQYQWNAEIDTVDMATGLPMAFLYSGMLTRANGQWWLRITATNDLSWVDNGNVPATVTRQGDTLTMSYVYSGTHLTIVWEE